ncbi:hemagglutinin repeat-containing protein [Massilia aurea]|uniref:hemagglutinin repeat-containing protein n=1 Tax=Massilia aurea TaxID=373040 RepID=UPI002162D7DD|nr:hemagglutinin repeat-containing protein [Massilia aurea]MCS0707110.1 hemagglutinin repeat-containing protein [Massilia aurea]
MSGKTIDIIAGKDINVRGSAIASEGDVDLSARGSVNIIAATSTLTERHHKEVKESGFLSGGGFGISYGERTTTTDQARDATTQSGQSRSMVGSLGGNLNITAGDAIKVSGSDLHAGRDMTLEGKSVTVDSGRDNVRDKFEQSTVQDGLTLAVGGSVVGALQTMHAMKDAASQSKDGRVQALAAATAALAAKNTANDIAQNGLNVSVSLTVGHSESHTSKTSGGSGNAGSTLKAGNDIKIVATGGGEASNINIVGSDVTAGGNVKLKADNEVNLIAAQDTESQHTDSSSMSAAAGVGASFGTSGTSIGFTASVSVGKGKEDGKGTTQLNTHVTAGNGLVIDSGGDTNIRGAVATGKQVVAKVGGDLNMESLQDTATFDSKNQSLSASGTVGTGVSVSGSFSDSKLKSDYASVQEQSGIRAGAGGFQVIVDGNTDLKGGVVSSSQEAIANGKNSLSTGTLTASDVANHADYKGHSVGLSGGVGSKGDSRDAAPNTAGVAGNSWKMMQTGGTGMNAPIAMGAGGSASSMTHSGISAGLVSITNGQQQQALTGMSAGQVLAELNRDVSNERDTSGKIENKFDQASIQAGFEVVGALSGQVSTFLADKARATDQARRDAEKADGSADRLIAEANALPEGLERSAKLAEADALRGAAVTARVEANTIDEQWGAGGTYRQVVTALTAAASGNISGATGEFIQRGLVNWAQGNAAGGIKQLAEDYGIAEGTPAHAALHAVSSCAGAGAAGANCGTAAVAAAGATLISSLLSAQDNDALSNEQKETRAALVQTLIVGAAVAAGAQADVANTAALIELENNSNVRKAVDDALKKAKDFVSKNGEKSLESVGNLLEKLEVKTLLEKQDLIKRFLNDAAGKGNLTEPQIAALAILYAANEVLFPTNVLDLVPGAGKVIAKTGDLIKQGVRAQDAVKIASATSLAKPSQDAANNVVSLASGEKWKWTKELNNPKPDTLHNVDDRYFYKTDASGRVGNVKGNLNLETFDRNKYQQCLAGKCGSVDDEGGHLIASIFSGPGEKLNIVPMNGNLNKGEWKKIENEWVTALKENKNVQVEISPVYDGLSERPSNFEVRYRIDGGRTVTLRLKNSPGGV